MWKVYLVLIVIHRFILSLPKKNYRTTVVYIARARVCGRIGTGSTDTLWLCGVLSNLVLLANPVCSSERKLRVIASLAMLSG